jgi:probable F420-dependent oxidoreductase
MEFWQAIPWIEPDQILPVARMAEELGFDGVLTADHALCPRDIKSAYPYSPDGKAPLDPATPYPDIWAITAAMAAVTTRIKFSCSIYVLPLRHPVDVAKSAGTVSLLSGGRFLLGAGSGWMKDEFDIYGVDFKTRGRRMDECIEVLRKLWAGGDVEHHGEFFDFPPMQVSPAPSAPVPILLGGAAPRALKRAAEVADGWIGAGNTPEEVPDLLAEMQRMRAAAGRGNDPFYTIVGLSTPADIGTLKRLGDCGMSAAVSYPFRYSVGEHSSLEAKRRVMEDYAENVIRHFR